MPQLKLTMNDIDNSVAFCQFDAAMNLDNVRDLFANTAEENWVGKFIKSVRFTATNAALFFDTINDDGRAIWYIGTGRVQVTGNISKSPEKCRVVIEEAAEILCARLAKDKGIVDPWVQPTLSRAGKRQRQVEREAERQVEREAERQDAVKPKYLMWTHYVGLLMTLFPPPPPPLQKK